MNSKKIWHQMWAFVACIFGFYLLTFSFVSAHEVYVLDPNEIASGIQSAPFDMVQVALQNLHEFIFWAFIVFVAISTIFFVSVFHRFENLLDPLLNRGKRYAHTVCRVTVALGMLAGAYYQAQYGPELPLSATWGAFTPVIVGITVVAALMIIFNVYVRTAAFIALVFYSVGFALHGIYMFTYTNYLGEFLVLFLLGAPSKHVRVFKEFWQRTERAVERYAWLIIRVSFGISLLTAAVYAKIIHNDLALQVAELPLAGHQFGVAHYLGFEPHFLVLGAALIEILIATFFIFGIEIRWTCIFLEFWLSLSLWYFGETVWPHLILIGVPIALFLHGYDRYSIEGWFFKRRKLEPVF